MSTIAYLPHFISPDEVLRVQHAIQRLQSGERAGLRLEKLRGKPVYSLRLNEKIRLLLCKHHGQWLVLELLENHEYDNARCLKAGVLKKVLADQTAVQELFEPCDEPIPALETPDWQNAFLHSAQPIILDNQQQETLRLSSPVLITGTPGAGKSSVCTALVQQLCWDNPGRKPTVLYMIPTTALQNQLQAAWEQNPLSAQAAVHFMTYAEGVKDNNKKTISSLQFSEWLSQSINQLVKKKKNDPLKALKKQAEEVRYEFSLIKALGADGYQQAGKAQTCFEAERRAVLMNLFNRYETHLGSNNLQDPGLCMFQSDLKPDLLVIDEGQNFLPYQQQQLAQRFTECGKIYICLDKEQCINTARLIENFIKQLYVRLKKPLHVHVLGKSYRCPPAVVAIANLILAYGQAHEPDKTGHHYRALESMLSHPGEARFYPTVDEHNLPYLNSLCQSPDTLVLSLPEQMKHEKLSAMGSLLTLPIHEVAGLEAETIILFEPLSGDMAKRFARRTADEPPTLKEWAWFYALFVACTRACSRLIIIQSTAYYMEELLTEVKKLCQSNLPQTDQALDEKSSWMKRYEELLQLGLQDQAEQIRAAKGLSTPTKPVPVSPSPKTPVPGIAPLQSKQLEEWIKKGQKELEIQLGWKTRQGANKALNGPTNLSLWLDHPPSSQVFLQAAQKTSSFKSFLKQHLYQPISDGRADGAKILLYRLVIHSHNHTLLRLIIAEVKTDSDIRSLKAMLYKPMPECLLQQPVIGSGQSWLELLILHHPVEPYLKMLADLPTKQWFEAMVRPHRGGLLLDKLTWRDQDVPRLYKALSTDPRPTVFETLGTEKQAEPVLLQMLGKYPLHNPQNWSIKFVKALLAFCTDNREALFVQHGVADMRSGLLNHLVAYFRNAKADPKISKEIQDLVLHGLKAPTLSNLAQAALFQTEAQAFWDRPVFSLLQSVAGRELLTRVKYLIDCFPDEIVSSLDENFYTIQKHLITIGQFDEATEQVLTLLFNDDRQVTPRGLEYYGEVIESLIPYLDDSSPTSPDASEKRSLTLITSPSLQKQLCEQIKSSNDCWQELFGKPCWSEKQIRALQAEILDGKNLMIRTFYQREKISRKDLTRLIAIIFTCSYFFYSKQLSNPVEIMRWRKDNKQCTYIVINRLALLDPKDEAGYQQAIILGTRGWALNLYSDQKETQAFRTMLQPNSGWSVEAIERPLQTVMNMAFCHGSGAEFVPMKKLCALLSQYLSLNYYTLQWSGRFCLPSAALSNRLLDAQSQIRLKALESLFAQDQDQVQKVEYSALAAYLLQMTNDQGMSLFEQMLNLPEATLEWQSLIANDPLAPRIALLLLREEIKSPSGSRKLLYLLAESNKGIFILEALLEYLFKNESDTETAILLSWIAYAFQPHIQSDGDVLHLSKLHFFINQSDEKIPQVSRLFTLACSQIMDWRFAFPNEAQPDHPPFVYYLFNPQQRKSLHLDETSLRRLMSLLGRSPHLLSLPFLNEQKEETNLLYHVLAHPENDFHYALLAEYCPDFLRLIGPSMLLPDLSQVEVLPDLSTSLLMQMVNNPNRCILVFKLIQRNPEFFERFKKLYPKETPDSNNYRLPHRSVFGRRMLKLLGLETNHPTFELTRKDFTRVIQYCKSDARITDLVRNHLGSYQETLAGLQGSFKIALLQMAVLNWDKQMIKEEMKSLCNSMEILHLAAQTVQSCGRQSLAERALITAYITSRLSFLADMDYEIRLIKIREDQYFVVANPMLEIEPYLIDAYCSDRTLIYHLNAERTLTGKELQAHLKKQRIIAPDSRVCIGWSSFPGYNNLLAYIQRQLADDNRSVEEKDKLKHMLALMQSDLVFPKLNLPEIISQFDPDMKLSGGKSRLFSAPNTQLPERENSPSP